MKKYVTKKFAASFFVVLIALIFSMSGHSQAQNSNATTFGAQALLNVTQPAKGSFYIDPAFGTKILRITDASDGGSATVAYSYWPVFNSNSTKMIIGLNYVPTLYSFDATNLSFQKLGPLFSGGDAMTWEGLSWSVDDPDTVYGLKGNNANIILRSYNTATKQYTFVHDFTAAGELPAGVAEQMSKARSNDRYFSFHWRPATGQPVKYAVAYDKQLNKTYIFDVTTNGVSNYDECRLDRDGRYLVISTGKEFHVWEFAVKTPQQQTIVTYDGTQRAGGHGDFGSGLHVHSDLWGNNGNRMIKRSLATPATWSQAFDSSVSDWISDQHISMLGPNDSWALVSTESSPVNYSLPFTNEIFLAKIDGSNQVIRLAQARTSNNDYWTTPRANLSPDGRFVAYNSDWNGGHNDVYVAVVPTGIWGTTSTPGNPTIQTAATPMTGNASLPVNFTGSASSPNGSISSYSWNFGDGVTATTATAAHTYTIPGSYSATLTVKDSANITASQSVTITVNTPPVTGTPTASLTASVVTGVAPLDIIFDGSTSSSPNGAISSYSWNYGDGTTATGKTVTKTYATAGTYTSVLTVKDVTNQTATVSKVVTITAATATNTTMVFANGDGKAGSATYDTSVMSAYPTYSIDTTYDNRAGGTVGAATLIAMPSLIGSGAGQIPAGAKIVSATLTLSIYSTQANTLNIQRILDPNNLGMWYSGASASDYYVGVSYGSRDARSGSTKKWNNAGGNLSKVLATADNSVVLTGREATGAKINLNVTASVAAWAAGAANQGWAITTKTATGNPINIYDSNNATSVRPVLTIVYSK